MNQQQSTKKLIDYINAERKNGLTEQMIYEALVGSGYDREYIVFTMTHLVHFLDERKAKTHNRLLIIFIVLGIIGSFIAGGDYVVYDVILSILFIYFFLKLNITAYYWYLFFAILKIGNLFVIITNNLNHIILAGIIGGIIILFPVYLSKKIISILLPNREGVGIGITQNGIHVFPEK